MTLRRSRTVGHVTKRGLKAKQSEPTYFEVKAILGEKVKGQKREYLVSWDGLDPDGKEWKPSWV